MELIQVPEVMAAQALFVFGPGEEPQPNPD
jgi:hypothetical protein